MMNGMKEFFVGTNRLTGTIPAELNQLTGLRALGLDENFFTGTIPFLWDMRELLILYLDSNQLTGTIHWEIKHLSQVVDLRLRKNFVRTAMFHHSVTFGVVVFLTGFFFCCS